jgi:glycyl-tRNA synthetase
MAEALDFQSIIFSLQQFWAEQGCLIWQPYNTQVGAGTNNPATFLRVLGPEPWKVAYVEPSIRPDDARYGENPYRMGQHYQFQVILKPDPGNPQELYLNSLQALGIDPSKHDIRFVEDNWESPALGAWGLGWEVWLDGQEITQFTYFQQAGGIQLNPPAVEITYGLERIAMPLQRVRHFRNINWNGQRTYGDINLQAEQQHSKYYFETAHVERVRQMYELYEAEAEAALEQGLILPAYDYLLRCSHTFNVLDTRGAVGVTERQALFSRMRDLSHRVAAAYVDERQRLEFPWLDESQSDGRTASLKQSPAPEKTTGPAPLLLEIGTEELPAEDLRAAVEQLRSRLGGWLADLRLEHGEVRIYGTPRRLVVSVEDVAPSQPDRETLHKGPPANRAFDSDGVATKAAEGFARSRGVNVEDLQVEEVEGGRYVVARVFEAGRSAVEVLAEALPGLVESIHFDRSMRWNETNAAFSRPLRWFLALLGEQVLPFQYAGLQSGRETRGLRFVEPKTLEIRNPADYFESLRSQGIVLDTADRRQAVAAQVRALIDEVGGDPTLDDGLLDEVTNLVEAPTALRGSFDERHLSLPREVLVSVMKKYQRYFPVTTADGKLLPYFIAVRNGSDEHLDVVRDGNEQVIGARFTDAAFFISEDLKHQIEDFLPRLSTLVFQAKLGSMLDKTHRVEQLVARLAPTLNLDEEHTTTARRAAALAKADLVSHMVVEMTALQGIMGRYYALHSGESQAVAEGIFEHYLPRFAGDDTPKNKPGLVVGLADRLDSLSGLFAAGLAPSGTKDPFAQRRAALGLVQNLVAWDLPFDLRHGLALAAELLPIPATQESQAQCLDFIVGRMRSYLIDQGYRYDVVDAVLAEQAENPTGAYHAAADLSAWVQRPDWHEILPAYARCVRITRDQPERYALDENALEDDRERDLYHALIEAEMLPRRAGSVEDFFKVFLPVMPAINRFFEDVLVMAEDAKVRQNRLGLLQRIAGLAKGVADFSKLEGF